MNNNWLKIFVPKVEIKVACMSEIRQLRACGVKIYHIKHAKNGYLVTIKKSAQINEEKDIVAQQSIYTTLLRFIIPLAFLWAMLLVAVEFITIDYEIRGNLALEDLNLVSEIIDDYFIKIGSLSIFTGDEVTLNESVASAFHDYVWVDVQISGSRLILNIFDTQIIEEKNTAHSQDTIYARATGMITQINASGCRILVRVNQVVYVGEALITCYTPTGFETDVAPINSVAAGIVMAEVWYEVEIEFPRKYAVRLATGSSRSNLFLTVGGNRLRVWGNDVGYDEFDERIQVLNPLSMFNIAPITIERVHYYEKSDIILVNEIERIRIGADDLVKTQLSLVMDNEFELVGLEFISLEENDEMVRLIYHATVVEDIAKSP